MPCLMQWCHGLVACTCSSAWLCIPQGAKRPGAVSSHGPGCQSQMSTILSVCNQALYVYSHLLLKLVAGSRQLHTCQPLASVAAAAALDLSACGTAPVLHSLVREGCSWQAFAGAGDHCCQLVLKVVESGPLGQLLRNNRESSTSRFEVSFQGCVQIKQSTLT